MLPTSVSELTCTRWMAQIRLQSGGDVVVHIHRGAPITARDALKAARQTTRFGKVAALLPVGPCLAMQDEE
ncbi:MAG: hypothetical protein KGP14_07140 [Betaproteobacteria bacterium]|nr:hypothetical protein [Betaproteobacteria bacterium]